MKNWKTMLLSITIIANSSLAEPQLIDKVAAIVNDGVVLKSEVDSTIQYLKLNADQERQQLPDNVTPRHQILERLILEQIIMQIGQKIGITVTDQQLNQTIANMAKQNNMTIEQIRKRLACEGISYSIYRNQIRKEMIISEVSNREISNRVAILPQEVEELAKQLNKQKSSLLELNLSYILIPLLENPTSDQVAKADRKAHSIVNQANNGSDFSILPTIYSTDQEPLRSGDMGWKHIQELPSIFVQALSIAKKGDIIGPIRSGIGLHIFKVNDIRGQNQNIYVTEVHARHILLKTSPIMTDDQAFARLQQIATNIKNGKISFANAAKEFSQDHDSAKQGGDLRWAVIDIYDPSLRDTLSKLKKGQISIPVHSSIGWHLIELLDTRIVDKTNATYKEHAYRILFNRKFSEEVETWMQEQRARAYVKILNN